MEKYDTETSNEIGLTCYYVAISAVQKCIRRGDATRAVNFFKVAWRMNSWKAFSRLWTILYEDCGRDADILALFFRHRGGGYDFENLVALVAGMANAKKSRDVNCLSFILRDHDVKPSILEKELKGTKHERLIQLNAEYKREELDAYSIWDFGSGLCSFDWTIELAEKSLKFDWEKFCTGMPYFFMVDMIENGDIIDECGELSEDELFDDWLPLCAIDDHTRPGKICFSTYLKYRKDKYANRETMGWWMFYHEGWMHNKLQPYSYDFAGLFDKMVNIPTNISGESFRDPAATKHFREDVVPEMNKLRRWWVTKHGREDFDKLKKAYESEWVEHESFV